MKQKKHYKKTESIEPGVENVVKEIVSLLQQVDTGYKAIFKYLRGELIKSRGQVHEMMKGAGLEVPPSEN